MSNYAKKDKEYFKNKVNASIKFNTILVKDWDASVRIYPLTVSEILTFEYKYFNNDKAKLDITHPEAIFELLSACVRDPEGNHIFLRDEKESFYDKVPVSLIRELWTASVSINWKGEQEQKKD